MIKLLLLNYTPEKNVKLIRKYLLKDYTVIKAGLCRLGSIIPRGVPTDFRRNSVRSKFDGNLSSVCDPPRNSADQTRNSDGIPAEFRLFVGSSNSPIFPSTTATATSSSPTSKKRRKKGGRAGALF